MAATHHRVGKRDCLDPKAMHRGTQTRAAEESLARWGDNTHDEQLGELSEGREDEALPCHPVWAEPQVADVGGQQAFTPVGSGVPKWF